MLEVTPSVEQSDYHLHSKLIQKPNMDQISVDFFNLEDEGHYEENVNKNNTTTDNDLDLRKTRDFFETKEPPDRSDFDPDAFLDPAQQSSCEPQSSGSTSSALLLFDEKEVATTEPPTATAVVENLSSSFDSNYKSLLEKYTEDALKSFQNKQQPQLKLESELKPPPAEDSGNNEPFREITQPIPNGPFFQDVEPTPFLDPRENKAFIESIADQSISFNLCDDTQEIPCNFEAQEVVDPRKIVEEILDELLPVSNESLVGSLLDEVISKVTLVSLPPPTCHPPPPLLQRPGKKVRGKIYPPTQPPLERPGRVTNKLEYIRKKVMTSMFNHKDSWPFRTPVDAIKLKIPDYHSIVKFPMDLGTIKKRLTNKYYWCAQEAQDDFKLMFGNCYLYNKPDYDIVVMCKELEKAYDKKIEQMNLIKELENETEGGFTLTKRGKRKLPSEAPMKKRPRFANNFYKDGLMDYEDEIPISQVKIPYRPHFGKYSRPPQPQPQPLPPAGLPMEESSSEESDEETDEDESEEDINGLSRKLPLYPRSSVVIPSPARHGGGLTDKKQKHVCRFCQQSFLIKYVRDEHEKKRHLSSGSLMPAREPSQPLSPKPGNKKVPPLKLNLKKPQNNSLQIMPIKQELEGGGQLLHNGPYRKVMGAGPGRPGPSPYQTDNTNTAFYTGAQGPNIANFPTQPYSESELLNFVDKKHKAINKQRLQKNNQTGQQYYRTHTKVQSSKPGDSLSSIPEELLFPDPPGPVQYQESRPANIISPPVHKFPKLSPDSGFPGSPDLIEQTSLLEAGNLNKPLGKLPGPPDVLKYCGPSGQNPSIIKHTTDPRLVQGPGMVQRPGGQPVMLVSSNNKAQRRFSHQSQDCPVPLNPLQQAAISSSNKARLVSGQTVINSKPVSVAAPPQQQQQQQMVGIRNGEQFVRGGRPSIVQHSGGLRAQAQPPPHSLSRPHVPPPATRPQLVPGPRPGLVAVPRPQMGARPGLVIQHQLVNRPMQPQPQPQGPRPIELQTRHRPVMSVTREVKLPTHPLPPTPAQQQQQQNKTNNLDVLAQTLKLSDLDFDFAPDSVSPALIPPAETQEIKLEDLKHLKDLKPVNNSNEDIKDLLDFNITYQDVNQLISDPNIFTSSSSVPSSSSSFLGTHSVQSNRAANSSLDASNAMFATNQGMSRPSQDHLAYSDIINIQPANASQFSLHPNNLSQEKRKDNGNNEKWWS